uniref:Phosphoenolpyruvate carboxylase n=1 Tax=Solanum chacoense TaxID=4108 RepID=A0A0V0I604_SOLCH
MTTRNLVKLASIDAQLRALVPGKVSEDDKLVEYDALLLDSFLDILQDLHGEDLKETVQECYELSAEYEGKHDPKKLEELGNLLTSLDPGDSIVIAKAFSHMLNLANLAEEVQIAYRRRQKLKKGDFADENNATTESDIEETFKKLVEELKKSPQEVFDALKNQTVDLVLTAHPTQSVRRSLLQKHGELSMWRCNDEVRIRADELYRSSRQDTKHYIEFWKTIPPSEPYRVILGDVRDKLYQTRERTRQVLAHGISDIPEDATYNSIEQFLEPLEAGHKDLLEGDPYLKQRLRLRDSYITTLNVLQAYTLKRIRDPNYHVKLRPHISKEYMESKSAAELVTLNPTSEYAPGLEDTLILTMKGIAAGMQNTG